ncbi:cas scaffolding protein family member 4 isoform X3 [Balaenoptera musculus]|uniref:Cas scaffolding protein family member 4 isoform X3 n=1 Tax=Balaenoptera musculus TaxID=9771 RepID=A0A8B8V5V1_BALMU|nr:cas scaffolding protein family member 4 isoform X3 [Balaenoptera musculus]
MKGASITDGAPKMFLARALYDNHPDCADELAFCRGDILTILEQNVPESEGWWKCLLHGRQGLAPANRLEILVEAPADKPCPPFLRGPEDASTSSQETYEVPTLLNPSSPGPVYEQMKSWVEGPPPPTVQVYEVPDPPASARIVCEKTLCFPKQALFTIPRPARTSLPALPCQVYDVPAQSRCLPALKEPGKQQQLYDIPPRPQKAALGPPASQPNGQSVPLMSSIALRRGSCNTLPSPQKSEWIYDTPVSPEKADELPSLEEKEKPILEQRLDENKDLETQNPSSLSTRPLSQQNPEKKIRLSEHGRLYFGALFKAIGVLNSSLGNSQPPEIFITQSKLVIMVGQKLVDTLCQETQERDVRNEILRGSSRLCSLLKDLALATKHAVLQHPSPTALGHLQAEAKKLERHTQQFRGTLE